MDETIATEELVKTLQGMAENLPALLATPVSIAANRLGLLGESNKLFATKIVPDLKADLAATKVDAVGAYNRGYIKGLAEGRE
jgi:hypothetical protein